MDFNNTRSDFQNAKPLRFMTFSQVIEQQSRNASTSSTPAEQLSSNNTNTLLGECFSHDAHIFRLPRSPPSAHIQGATCSRTPEVKRTSEQLSLPRFSPAPISAESANFTRSLLTPRRSQFRPPYYVSTPLLHTFRPSPPLTRLNAAFSAPITVVGTSQQRLNLFPENPNQHEEHPAPTTTVTSEVVKNNETNIPAAPIALNSGDVNTRVNTNQLSQSLFPEANVDPPITNPPEPPPAEPNNLTAALSQQSNHGTKKNIVPGNAGVAGDEESIQNTPTSHLSRPHVSVQNTPINLLPRPPKTPSSNFHISLANSSSDDEMGGSDNDSDADRDSIFPSDCGIGRSLRELALSRMMSQDLGDGDERISGQSEGDAGSINAAVIRQRRRILEGRMDNSDSKDIVASVIWAAGRFAAAQYDLETGMLYMLPDITDSPPDFGMLRTFLTQMKATYLVFNKSSDERFLHVLNELTGASMIAQAGDEDNENPIPSTNSTSVQNFSLHSKEFGLETCTQRVRRLKLPFEPQQNGFNEHIMFVTALIPFSNGNMIRAVGSLLNFVDRNAIELFQLELVEGQAPVLDVKLVKMDEVMLVDDTAWKSLQIFSTEMHPSSMKHGKTSGGKEGLSVYSLLNHCLTADGSKKLRQFLLSPSRNMETLINRYEILEYFQSLTNADFTKSIRDCLKAVKSIPKLLHRLSCLRATVNEWKEFSQTLYSCLLIGEMSKRTGAPALLARVGTEENLTALRFVTQEMRRIIDFDESVTSSRIVVRSGLDAKLDKKKKQFSCLPELLSVIASEEIVELPEYVTQCCVVYIPEIGYMLALNLWRDDLTDPELVIEGLEYRFRSLELAYYKTARMRELDVVLGDLTVSILEIETVFMVRLTQTILEKTPIIIKIGDLVAELDSFIALSTVALHYNLVRPKLSPAGGVLKILEGRHLISNFINEDFVPNSTEFQDEEKVVIITGPNASGKSVYLKQVGIIIIMALSGSFVPASFARIPLYDKIFTRIHAIESISEGYSSFKLDLNQMSIALRNSCKSSLLLIDEFGKGTADTDGFAILTATFKSLIQRGKECPTVFLSTHFHALYRELNSSPFLKFQTMKFIETQKGDITYLFQIQNGVCESSFAQLVAKNEGIPIDAVARADEIEHVVVDERKVLQPIQMNNQEIKENVMLAFADEFLSTNFDTSNPVVFSKRVKRRLEAFE